MLPTYTVYLDDWYRDEDVYGKVINWDDMCKLNDLHAYASRRATDCFMLVTVRPKDSAPFPYIERQAALHRYSHIPELTSDQVDQLIFIHSLDQ